MEREDEVIISFVSWKMKISLKPLPFIPRAAHSLGPRPSLPGPPASARTNPRDGAVRPCWEHPRDVEFGDPRLLNKTTPADAQALPSAPGSGNNRGGARHAGARPALRLRVGSLARWRHRLMRAPAPAPALVCPALPCPPLPCSPLLYPLFRSPPLPSSILPSPPLRCPPLLYSDLLCPSCWSPALPSPPVRALAPFPAPVGLGAPHSPAGSCSSHRRPGRLAVLEGSGAAAGGAARGGCEVRALQPPPGWSPRREGWGIWSPGLNEKERRGRVRSPLALGHCSFVRLGRTGRQPGYLGRGRGCHPRVGLEGKSSSPALGTERGSEYLPAWRPHKPAVPASVRLGGTHQTWVLTLFTRHSLQWSFLSPITRAMRDI